MQYDRLVLITPFAMTSKLDEVLTKIHTFSKVGNTLRKKMVLVNSELIKKHFDYLLAGDLQKIVDEWSGSQIWAFIVTEVPTNAQDELMHLAYISSNKERAIRDMKLWFPELYVN